MADDEEISSEVDDIYDSKNNNNKDRKKKQRSRSGDNQSNNETITPENNYDDGNSSEDSDFGSFNPNLHAVLKNSKKDDALERLGPNLSINSASLSQSLLKQESNNNNR